MPPAVVGWQVPMCLVSVTHGEVFVSHVADNYKYREGPGVAMPVRFHGQLPDVDDVYELHIGQWDRFVYVPSTGESLEHVEQGLPHEVELVMPPIRGISSAAAATLVFHNVRYHSALHIKVAAYVLLPQLQSFRQHAALQPYFDSHKLKLVLWNDFYECSHSVYCQHTLENSLATLDNWGASRLLVFADVDEYVAFPPDINVTSFVDTCFAGHSQVMLSRHNIGCSQCTNESALWLDEASADHPLTHYDVTMSVDTGNGKSIVDPADVLGFAVHYGSSLHGKVAHGDHLSRTCGRVLHIVNMFRHRADAKGSTTSSKLHLPPGLNSRP